MSGWPDELIRAADRNFKDAERLLHVQKATQVDSKLRIKRIKKSRPVYGGLQTVIQARVDDHARGKNGIYRTEPAPLASAAQRQDGIDFKKFATPGPLLELVEKQRELAQDGTGAPLDILCNCTVYDIIEQFGHATALKTSRGDIFLGVADLVLAMGTLPPTTLVQNSFPSLLSQPDARLRPGERFSAHFITSIVARVPRDTIPGSEKFGELEIAACYIAGVHNDNYKQQFHIQLSCLSDKKPEKNASKALRYMPDVVATASKAQLLSSKDHVVYVCAVLGELDYRNPNTYFRHTPLSTSDPNPTTNSFLQVVSDTQADLDTWKTMDDATFGVIEDALAPGGRETVEYWHGTPDEGTWISARPDQQQYRVDALVHESSTMHIGKESEDPGPVDVNYLLKGTQNVFVTGGALWPQGGSWNPTLTMAALSMDLADKLVSRRLQEDAPEAGRAETVA